MRRLTIAAVATAASILALSVQASAQEAEVDPDPEASAKSAAAEAPVPVGRADENAITAAPDAFGTIVGRETIRLYTSFNIRGFSPISAGNARIAGLYFDHTWGLNSRIRKSLIRILTMS